MKLPGFTAVASLNMARGAYRASASRDTLDRTGTHKAGGVELAVNCSWLQSCCAQVPPGNRSLSECCISYDLYCK
jgi:hypothetical protein